MEMDDNKRRRNMILYVLIAFVVYLVLSTVLFPNIGHTQQITKTDYSTFVKALDKKSVDKVEYNTDDYTIYYTKKGEDENIAYKTTGVPNDAGFTDRVLESGASLESVVPDKNSGLMTYYLLTLILPMGIFFLIGWWLNRRDRLASKRWLLRTAVWSVPLAYLASQAGWVVAEVGRPPWAIQDLMPVGIAASKIGSTSVTATFFIFLALFTALLIAELSILFRQIKIGPEQEKE